MKKLLFVMLTLGTLTAYAEELVPKISCVGIDSQKNVVNVSIFARTRLNRPVTNHIGPLFVTEIGLSDNLIQKYQAINLTQDGLGEKYSNGSGEFILSFDNSETSVTDKVQKANLYFYRTDEFGRGIQPLYNPLAMTCKELNP